MLEPPRIEELRRRVEANPGSIVFAQLAEEYRRFGDFEAAIRCCRAGLEVYPQYLSARVTLGRALIALGRLDEARGELEIVLRSAPDNLAAIRGMAEIHHQLSQEPTPAPAPGTPASASASPASTALAAPPAPAPPTPLPTSVPVDLDQVLSASAAPAAKAPPIVDARLSTAAAEASLTPESGSSAEPGPAAAVDNAVGSPSDPLAALEERLRAFDVKWSRPVDPADRANREVIAQLEAWLAVLEAERAAGSASERSKDSSRA